MGIICTIAIEHEDGTVEKIYCDYGLSGMKLYNHYSDRDKVNELISLGNIIEVGNTIDTVSKWEEYEPPTKFSDYNDYVENLENVYSYIFTKDNVWLLYDEDEPKKLITLESVIQKINSSKTTGDFFPSKHFKNGQTCIIGDAFDQTLAGVMVRIVGMASPYAYIVERVDGDMIPIYKNGDEVIEFKCIVISNYNIKPVEN